MKKLLVSIIIFCLVQSIFVGCEHLKTESAGNIIEADEEQVQVDEMQESNKDITEEEQQFLQEFSRNYSNYELLDYVVGTEKNDPILLVVIAKNLIDGTSSTLFIKDEKGVGKVVLAADSFATYRSDEEIKLSGNIVHVSLDIQKSVEDGKEETFNEKGTSIHDFEITVTQDEKNGVVNTMYSSKEVLRNG